MPPTSYASFCLLMILYNKYWKSGCKIKSQNTYVGSKNKNTSKIPIPRKIEIITNVEEKRMRITRSIKTLKKMFDSLLTDALLHFQIKHQLLKVYHKAATL